VIDPLHDIAALTADSDVRTPVPGRLLAHGPQFSGPTFDRSASHARLQDEADFSAARPLVQNRTPFVAPTRYTVDSSSVPAQSSASPSRHAQPCCHVYGAQQPCQICGLNGHLASHCHLTDIGNNYQGRRQVALAAQGYPPSYHVDASWYLDTGATDHLMNQVDKLTI
jgi:hypothetical protein